MNATLLTPETESIQLRNAEGQPVSRTTFFILYGGPKGSAQRCRTNKAGESNQHISRRPAFDSVGVYQACDA